MSAEVVGYRATLVEGKRVRTESQSNLDGTTQWGQLADTPWIPR